MPNRRGACDGGNQERLQINENYHLWKRVIGIA